MRVFGIIVTLGFAQLALAQFTPPKADKLPHQTTVHGVVLQDDYFWLRERDNPKVMTLLRAERAYCDQSMAHTADRQQTLYDEMLERIEQTDMSVPYREGSFTYYNRTEEGKPYKIYCRKPYPDGTGKEQVIFDANEAAAGSRNFRVGTIDISPDGQVAAIATDKDGEEKYTVAFRDLRGDHDLPEKLEGVSGDVAWAADGRTIFYTTLDEAHRPYKLFRHALMTDPAGDALVYHEKDEAFSLGVELSRSQKFILIESSSKDTSEWRFMNARLANNRVTIIEPRHKGHEYSVDHHENRFLILTNDGAPNFRLVEAPLDQPGMDTWRELLPGRSDVLLESIEAFKNHLVVVYRQGGLPHVSIRNFAGLSQDIPTTEPSYAIAPEINPEYGAKHFRYTYSSPITPTSVHEIDMDSGEATLLKQQPVIGYDPSLYAVELAQIKAPDGQLVPLTITHRKDLVRNGNAPALLTGYSAYGFSARPAFSSADVSLLDRGFVLAEAHSRGGSDNGRTWYDDGKLMRKKNTFTDFIACAEFLVANQYTSPEHLAIRGGSAGGLLMGAVTTMRPDLFEVVVAEVPFVDVINTMLDPTLPLTITEYDEWGNPGADQAAFEYIRSYSPYDNTRPAKYPSILLTSGLNDPRVSYWEPAKWAQRLRENNTGANEVLFKVELDAGHGGMADRYAALHEEAFVQAFILDRLRVPEPEPLDKKAQERKKRKK
ncbi:MAG: S9 family peptidase [Phycisphaeraceae bacterium]|nr:S9 family peptidase [Phycisphaeraceae bacterium]